ncbi:MAG: VOC family protein [Burkholderiales bacterium]
MSDSRDDSPPSIRTASYPPGAYPDIDHVAYFLPDIERASGALTALGFTLTPFSAQSHRLEPGGPLVPAGTGNCCIMLKRGYVECLTPTHDTPNAAQLRMAIHRYTGVHLIAFGTQTPETDFQRLSANGFQPLTPVALQRQAGTASGEATARFTVVRVAPATMAEGRIQFCQHHTRDVVWQPRWATHANHAVGLAGVLLCVADPAEAAQRYARFTGLRAQPAGTSGDSWRLDGADGKGYLLFASPALLQQSLRVSAPVLPWIAGCIIDSDDMNATQARLNGNRIDDRLLVKLDASLGGIVIFQSAGSPPLQLEKMHEYA